MPDIKKDKLMSVIKIQRRYLGEYRDKWIQDLIDGKIEEDKVYLPTEVAYLLGVNLQTVRLYDRQGKIKSVSELNCPNLGEVNELDVEYNKYIEENEIILFKEWYVEIYLRWKRKKYKGSEIIKLL